MALTFAGEQREYVRRVAARLATHIGHAQVFFDDNYKATLTRLDLDSYLIDIYRNAELVVPFLSKEYKKKEWCQVEWRAVRTVMFEGRRADVMLCRFDEAEVEGALPIDGYLDLGKLEPEEVADLIFERLTTSPSFPDVSQSNRTLKANVTANPDPGAYSGSGGAIPSQLLTTLNLEFGQYAAALSQEIREKLERIHEKYRKGKVEDARNECRALRNNTETWRKLEASAQAKVLQQLARYELDFDTSDDEIRQLIAEANALDPELDDTIVRVMLCCQEQGAEAGLVELGEPKTVTTFNLRLSLLLQLGDFDSVLTALQDPPTAITPDTESIRFHALALLAKGAMPEARTKVEQALSEHSEWEFVQLAAAMIDYWSGMADGLTTPKMAAAPAPTALALAKSNPESLQYFSKAAQRFAALIESTQRGVEQKQRFETWRLASLANDPGRQQEASAYCQELLTRNPAHHRVLLWALTRDYPIDVPVTEAALEQRLNEAISTDEGLAVEITTTLRALYLTNGKRAEAQFLLDKTKGCFTNEDAGDIWAFWQVQRMLAAGEFDEALDIAQQAKSVEMQRRFETMILHAQAIKTQEFGALAHQLDASFQETGEPHYLFEFCELSFELRDWEAVVKYAQQLVEIAANPHSIELAAVACWNCGRHISALAILENRQTLFLAQRFPDHLWRLKLMCLLRSGRTVEAIAEVKAIVQTAPTTDNLRTCVDACVQIGDLVQLRAIARELMSRDEVPFETLAKMASLLSVCDPELAKKYLLRARDGLLEHPQYAALLFDTSSRLNLEQAIGPLFRQIVDAHPKEVTNVWTVPVKDFPAQQQRMRERQQWTAEQYGKGDLPIHWIASQGNPSLVELLHAIPEWNRSHFVPRRRPVIYIRHGAHLVKNHLVASSANWRIHADITSLILAESLGVLDKVAAAFEPIMISPSVQSSLIWQMNQLSPQASRVKNCQNILRMRDEEQFHLVAPSAEEMAASATASQHDSRLFALARKARNEGGYVVTYLPLTTLEGEPIAVPPELAAYLINCRAVLESLKELGWLGDTEHQEAHRGLGTEGRGDAIGAHLPEKTKLFLEGNIAETLEGAGLLAEVCECFDVWVDEQQIEWANQQHWLNVNREQLQRWLSDLIERLRAGLENGKYQTISLPDVLPDKARDNDEWDSLETNCLQDLLLIEPQDGDVIWIDDRSFNRHPTAVSNIPVIAISEILSALQTQDKLNERKYFDKLLALRTGNFRYIPLSQFEILYHLRGAALKEKTATNKRVEIVETKPLKKLRSAIAASLLDKGCLRPDSEGWYLHSVNHSVKAAILLLWKDENIDVERARACSDWILENLFVSPVGYVHLCELAVPRRSFDDAIGEVLSDYLTGGLAVSSERKTQHLRRQAYFNWLSERILIPCFNADSQIITATAKHFRETFRRVVPAGQSEELLTVSTFQMFLELRLPEDLGAILGKELLPDANAYRSIGLSSPEVINFGSFHFSTDSLIGAFEKAWREGIGEVREIGEKQPCRIIGDKSPDSGERCFFIEKPSTQFRRPIGDDLWQLLAEDTSSREKILRRNRTWFDCDQQTFEFESKRIAALENFSDRFNSVRKLWEHSAALYYQELHQVITGDESPGWRDLMPPILGLLRHFRLATDDQSSLSITERLSQSAAILLREEGLHETLERFACLPVRLPELLVAELTKLPREERIRVLKGLGRRWTSPLSSLHLIDLVLSVGDSSEDTLAITRSALDWLVVEEHSAERFKLFRQTLRLVSTGFERISEAKQLDVATRLLLVWAHASRLHNIYGLIGNGITFSWVDEWSKWESNFTDSAYVADGLHPQRISRPVFLAHGLSAIFANQDKTLIDTLGIAEMLADIAFVKSGEQRLPAIQLLCDPTLVSNRTESFLSGDKTDSIRILLGDEAASLLSPVGLHGWIEEALINLKNNPEESAEWIKILLVTDDLALPPDLASSFWEMAEKLDLLALYKSNSEAATMAIRVIAAQFAYPHDEILIQRFEQDVLQIVLQNNGQRVQQEQEDNQQRRIAGVIGEVAVKMIFRDNSQPGEARSTEGLLLRLIEYAAQFRDLIPISGLARIVHEMPPDKAWRLWPVLLAARATP